MKITSIDWYVSMTRELSYLFDFRIEGTKIVIDDARNFDVSEGQFINPDNVIYSIYL